MLESDDCIFSFFSLKVKLFQYERTLAVDAGSSTFHKIGSRFQCTSIFLTLYEPMLVTVFVCLFSFRYHRLFSALLSP